MISIKNGEEYYLGKNNGNKILDINFIGIGGAFDIEEGSSSVIFKTKLGKEFLIDCGHSSYEYLKKNEKLKDIDVIFITHMHSDHVNGLSTLIFDRFYIHKLETIIECTEAVGEKLRQYLNICGHPEDQYVIQTGNAFFEEERISVTKIDTTAHHWPYPGFPNSGLLFHFETENDYAVVIYSGDINVPITSLMSEENYPFVYEKPENVFIFHDMTSLVHEQNPHTNFDLLVPVQKRFGKNLFTYHHGEEQVAAINKVNPSMALTSLILQGNSFVIEGKRGV